MKNYHGHAIVSFLKLISVLMIMSAKHRNPSLNEDSMGEALNEIWNDYSLEKGLQEETNKRYG